jgi:hypothetical protein
MLQKLQKAIRPNITFKIMFSINKESIHNAIPTIRKTGHVLVPK